jgi:hypothetical protein
MSCDLAELGTFDVSLFLGVLYHLDDPLGALRRLRAVTRELAVVETAAICIKGQDRPLLEFTPGAEVKNDPTNWFFPNEAAAVALLHAAGFADVRPVARLFHEHDRPGVTDFRLVLRARPQGARPDWRWTDEDALSRAQAQIRSLEGELARLRQTRTFRYTALPRRLYERLRPPARPQDK